MSKRKIEIDIVKGLAIMYITGINYFGFQLPIEPSWGSQNAPSFFYPLLLTMLSLLYFKNVNGFIWECIGKLGDASYHIFLTQMVYFWGVGGVIKNVSLFLITPINIIICSLCGYLFYRIEKAVRKQ